jgi:pimeloyl-ACP methyl ester carboxylesterase
MMNNKNIILLHGWGASAAKLSELGNRLENLGWNVVIPKLPGFDAAPPKKEWRLVNYSNYVASLPETQKMASFVCFGHSFGGRLAIKMSGNKKVTGLVFCATGGLSRGNPIKRFIFSAAAKTGKILLFDRRLAGAFKKILYKFAREHDYEKTKGSMRQTFKNVISEDLKKEVKSIKKPALVLWGKEDRMTPIKDAFYLKKHLKNSKLVIYDKEGHRLPYTKAGDIAKEIDTWYKTL